MATFTLTSVPDYLGEGPYQATIAKGSLGVPLRFFAAETAWQRFAQELLTFPRTPTERLFFDARHVAPYRHSLLLEAYCYDAAGHCALRVVFDNNYPDPGRCQLTFSLPAEAASLNHLGTLLGQWLARPASTMQWEAQTS